MELPGLTNPQYIRVAIRLIRSISDGDTGDVIDPGTGEQLVMAPLRAAASIAEIAANINGIPPLPEGYQLDGEPFVGGLIKIRMAVDVVTRIQTPVNLPEGMMAVGEINYPYIDILQASIRFLKEAIKQGDRISLAIQIASAPVRDGSFPPQAGHGRRTRRHRARKARTVRRRAVHRR